MTNATIVDIKARCEDPERIRGILKAQNASYDGLHHQRDIYFKTPEGKLKLRKSGETEKLAYYQREYQEGSERSRSDATSVHVQPSSGLEELLTRALGVSAVVDKEREIYSINNMRFHIDQVSGLGRFVEIEAIDDNGNIGVERLREQCNHYLGLLGIKPEDLLTGSYSDLLLVSK